MKIIKHGTPKPVVEMIAECPECKCVFTFSEIESTRCSNNGGGSLYFTKCPECGHTGCAFDTGYPGNTEKDREDTRQVREKQAALRSLIKDPHPLAP
jgi:hypothetical protein